MLTDGGGPYPQRAMVVVTDGVENRAPWINDAALTVSEPTRVFCVGIGRPQDVNTSKLQALSGNQGGYLLLTGASASLDSLLLQKYLLRILTNATNLEVLLDPPTLLQPGKVERIPFSVCEFDESFDAIVLSPQGDRLAFALEAPDGSFVTPVDLEAVPGSRYLSGSEVACYRIRLPLLLGGAPAVAAGTWHLLLTAGDTKSAVFSNALARSLGSSQKVSRKRVESQEPLRCETLVHARSELRMAATLQQTGVAPGARMLFEVLLTVRGQAFDGPVRAEARLEDSTGFSFAIPLQPEGTGRYVGEFDPSSPGSIAWSWFARARHRNCMAFGASNSGRLP